jgi:hypothetical protein
MVADEGASDLDLRSRPRPLFGACGLKRRLGYADQPDETSHAHAVAAIGTAAVMKVLEPIYDETPGSVPCRGSCFSGLKRP